MENNTVKQPDTIIEINQKPDEESILSLKTSVLKDILEMRMRIIELQNKRNKIREKGTQLQLKRKAKNGEQEKEISDEIYELIEEIKELYNELGAFGDVWKTLRSSLNENTKNMSSSLYPLNIH